MKRHEQTMRGWKESDLQKAQVKYLESRRDLARDVMFCAIPNDSAMFAANGRVNYAKMQSLRDMGLVPGAMDLMVWMRGRLLHIENKVKGRGQSDAQKAFGEGLVALGYEYHVISAHTPANAVEQLERLLDA